MKTTTSTIVALTLDMLPALGEALDGGIFAGIQYHYYRSAELSAVAVRRIL